MNKSVILDTRLTFSAVNDETLLTGVEKTKDIIRMETNVGSRILDTQGTMPGMTQKVWLDKKSIANIFSFKNVKNDYRVTYDSFVEDAFILHMKNGKIKFEANESGLYMHTFLENYLRPVEELNSVQLNMTVAENRKNYS
ncbi:MAG: hypothetical protein AAF514_12125, partial [Verrucomicrobiota bacterium]